MFRSLVTLLLITFIYINSAYANCSNEDTFKGKASFEYPKPTGFLAKAKATPEVIEKTENLAKSKILEAYIIKLRINFIFISHILFNFRSII